MSEARRPLPPFADVPLGEAAGADLTRAILARTSGSPCARVRERACDYVDGALAEGPASLLRAHQDHCPACAALVGALAEASRLLPALAAVDPGPWFAARVARATLRRPRPAGWTEGWAAGWGESAWGRLMRRPRIALETATLGAMLGLVGVSVPQPLRQEAFAEVAPLARAVAEPARRVAGQMIQAERRTAASLRRAILPSETFQAGPAQSWWARASQRLRAWLRPLRRSEATPAPSSDHPQAPPNR